MPKFLWLLVCFFGLQNAVFAQNQADWQYRFKRKKCECTVLPFEMQQNLIIVPIFINDSDTMRFVFDSGARYTIITRLGVGNDLNLNHARKTKMTGLGRGEDIEALISLGNILHIAELSLNHQLVGVLLTDIFHLDKQLGANIHGILGLNILKDFIVKTDYSHKKIYICRSWKKLAKEKLWQNLPAEIMSEKFYIRAFSELPDEQKDSVKLLLDSGAGHALMLSVSPEAKFLTNLPDSYLGSGLNGQIFGKIGKVNTFGFGDMNFKKVNASFPDTLSLRAFYIQQTADGSIGAEVMRRFDWVFDAQAGRVFFKPNRQFFAPFRFNVSGIEVSKPFVDLPFFWVEQVRKNSPAFLAGVKAGDQILSLNGKAGKDLSMNYICKQFQDDDGKKVRMTVSRDGKRLKFEFMLDESKIFNLPANDIP